MIYQQGVNTKHLFSIEINEDGKYFAIREKEPLFCVEDDTIKGVCLKAEQCFEAYKELISPRAE